MIELLRDAAQATCRVLAGWALDGALVLLRAGRRLTPPSAPVLRLVRPQLADDEAATR